MDAIRPTVPLLDLKREYAYLKTQIDQALATVLEHQTWILGPEVQRLEQHFSEFIGAPFAIGASSGTEALLLALRAIAMHYSNKEYFDPTDEIVTTAFSFTATGDTILRSRATPVFVDIDPETYNIDLDQLEQCLATRPNVRAVIVVHLYGQCIDADRLIALRTKYGVPIIEDVAQACGAQDQGRYAGTIGDIGSFSFFPSKNLGAFGDAGIVTAKDKALADLIRILTKHGGKDKYDVEYIGYNARLDTIQAAVLLAKLPALATFNQKRREIGSIYNAAFKDIPGIRIPSVNAPSHVYHQYTVRVLNGKRAALKRHLDEAGISSMVYYPVPLNRMKVFNGRSVHFSECACAAAASDEVLSLPIEPLLSGEEIERVLEVVKAFF